LKLNFKTLLPGAFVEVEIVDGSLPNRASATLVLALEGFSFADCDRLSGTSWKQSSAGEDNQICRRGGGRRSTCDFAWRGPSSLPLSL
jgi:hypothetical protein